MRKLIIQIPCFEEAEHLPVTLGDLPRAVPGFERVEWLVVDDGSTDGTAEAASRGGVDHVVRLSRHRGLARAFTEGLEASLRLGADVIVNVDADNQYRADDIVHLVAPILRGDADMVVGARPIDDISHFSPLKKALQRLGSRVVRMASGTDVPDATSGFRALSREAARRLHVFSEYSYTLETIIQAGWKGLAVASVPVRVNPDLRPSKLVTSLPAYLRRQLLTILRIFVTYRPFFFFASLGAVAFGAGFLLGLRFLYFYLTEGGGGHVQSVILASLLLGSGLALGLIGLVADLVSVNRKLLEEVEWRVQRLEISEVTPVERADRDASAYGESGSGSVAVPE